MQVAVPLCDVGKNIYLYNGDVAVEYRSLSEDAAL